MIAANEQGYDPWTDKPATTTLPRQKKNPGFHWLKKTDPTTYDHFRKFCSVFIDQYDWGYLHESGEKPRANSNQRLDYWFGHKTEGVYPPPPRPKKLTLSRLQRATETTDEDRSQTLYVCSNPTSRYALIMLDVDDKDGKAGDAQKVYEALDELLVSADLRKRGCHLFGQPSTFGRGYHGFGFVDHDGLTARQIRDLLNELEKVLVAFVASKGFRSAIEVKCQPSVVQPNGTYAQGDRGILAKFPRLGNDISTVKRFLYQTPLLQSSDLRRIVDEVSVSINYMVEGGGTEEADILPSSSPLSLHHIVNGYNSNPDPKSNPGKRMADCATSLSNRLTRPATTDEILAEYHRLNLNTGNDVGGKRVKRAERCAQWLATNWKAPKPKGYDSAIDKNLRLIREHVTDKIRQVIKKRNRYAYTDEELAVVLFTIEQNSTRRHPRRDRQFGCPINAVIEMAKTIGRPFEGDAPTVRHRLANMKHALADADLIVTVDDTWHTGKGKKYGLGPSHPRYAEFTKLATALDIDIQHTIRRNQK